MTDKFYLDKPEEYVQETPEEIKARERHYLVNWMRSVMAEKKTDQARKAFMSKVHSAAAHHGITFEELMKNEE